MRAASKGSSVTARGAAPVIAVILARMFHCAAVSLLEMPIREHASLNQW
jgi:hypothetical protein